MNKLFRFPILIFFFLTLVSCQSINAFNQLESLFHINGSSMYPTFIDGTTLGIDEDAYRDTLPQRGDLVVFKHPTSNLFFVKRVVGLPNESVEMKEGSLLINGVILEESYIEKPA